MNPPLPPSHHRAQPGSPLARGGGRGAWRCALLGILLALAVRGEPALDLHVRMAQRTFTYRDGLPQNTVQALALDPREGRLWAGTQDGLASFDGRSWQSLALPDPRRANYVRTLAFDPDGSLWAGTNADGLHVHRKEGWVRLEAGVGPAPRRVNTLLRGSGRDAAILWVGTHDQGLLRLEGGRIQEERLPGIPSAGPVWALREAPWGGRPRLWAGLEGALAYREGGAWHAMDLPEPMRHVSLNSFWTDPAGTVLWVGTFGQGVWRWDGRWTRFGRGEGLPGGQITSLAATEDAGGGATLWVGTFSGLARWDGSRWRAMGHRGDPVQRPVYSLLATRAPEGGACLWVGTRGAGLVRLDMGRWDSLDDAAGLPPGEIRALLPGRGAGKGPGLWMGGERGGLLWLGREGMKAWPLPGGGEGIHCLLEDREGPWLGTRDQGVLRLRRGALEAVDGAGWRWGEVFSLVRTGTASGPAGILAGGSKGLARLEGGLWRPSPHPEVAGRSIQILRTPPGRRDTVYVGTRADGLYRLEGGNLVHFGTAQGLPNPWVRGLAFREGASGPEVWIGTAGGLAILDERTGTLRGLTPRQQAALPGRIVNQVAFDTRDRAYLMTTRGIARLATEDALPEVFTGEDGLPEGECTPGSSAWDADGCLWVGTSAGLAHLDPARELPDRSPKRLILEGVRSGGKPLPLVQGASFGHGRRDWSFSFALLAFTRTDRIRYQTHLVGYEEAPGPWSAESTRTYTNLPAGTYTLRVLAQDGWGNPSEPLTWTFTLRPALWATWWARTLLSLAGAGLLGLLVRARLRVIHGRARLLEGAVALRTRELREARDAALEASRHKTDFLAVMSHEVRTPLNGILGMSDLLLDTALDPIQKEYVEAIRLSNQHLSCLINDVLDLSKIEADRLDLECVPFDLVAELEEVAAPLASVARSKGLDLVCDLPGNCPPLLRGDPTRLRQVVLNLLTNAVKFTRRGLILVRAEALPRGSRTAVRVEVTDTGVGIPAQVRARIFEPFRQADASTTREFGGTGLGLSICQRLLERMGGRIGVDSEPGTGSTFWFELELETGEPGPPPRALEGRVLGLLPREAARRAMARVLEDRGARAELHGDEASFREALAAAPPGAFRGILADAEALDGDPSLLAAQAAPKGPLALLAVLEAMPRLAKGAAAGAFQVIPDPWRQNVLVRFLEGSASPREVPQVRRVFHGRVLVVDDHPINRKVVLAQLARLGLEAEAVPGGAEALVRLGEAPFDLVLMDCEMPGLDGFETTRRLRASEASPVRRLPVVALTAHVLTGTREKCLASGMDDYLPKPVGPQALQEILERWLPAPMPAP